MQKQFQNYPLFNLKSCGLSRQKVRGIKSLAKQTLDKSFQPEINS